MKPYKAYALVICVGCHIAAISLLMQLKQSGHAVTGISALTVLEVSIHPPMPMQGNALMQAMPAPVNGDKEFAPVDGRAGRSPVGNISPPRKNGDTTIARIPTYYSAAELTRMPEALSDFEPRLSKHEDNGAGGKLGLRLWIDDSGIVNDVTLLTSDVTEAFQDAAISAFRQMRFNPGEVEGLPVKVWVDIVIEYAELQKPTE